MTGWAFGFLLFIGFILYVMIGVGAYGIMDKKLRWADDECAICASAWPITLLYWVFIGWPVKGISRMYKKMGRLLTRTKYKPTEVK